MKVRQIIRDTACVSIIALGILSFVGCDVLRQIPVQYNNPTIVSMEPGVSVSASQWNYEVITIGFDLPDGVLISPADVVINGKPRFAVWSYFPQTGKESRKNYQKTEPFTTFSIDNAGGECIQNILTLEFSYTSRPKKPETIQIDLSEHITLEGQPVFPEPIILSL
jgi:hypothetical protein